MNRQNELVSLGRKIRLAVWVVAVVSVFALVLALIMQCLPEGILRAWSAVFASVAGAVITLLPIILRSRQGQ
jgi:hypothetical protein